MGQAFRRASGRIKASDPLPKPVGDRRPPPPPPASTSDKVEISKRTTQNNIQNGLESVGTPRVNLDNVLEERNPQYDAMLSQMVGRITTKPGGKSEIGEASVVEMSKRPMPKLRNTTTDTSRFEERPAPPGTLNVAQLRRIILLHQGKADDHNGPMEIHEIAEKFRINAAQVQTILQFISLPPEDTNKKRDNP